MDSTPYFILIGVAGLLSIIGLIKPEWRLTSVAVFLVCVALFAGKK